MQIGLITYHRALNYGAVLQAYALQQTIQSLLADKGTCKILDYKCYAIEDMGVLIHHDKRMIKDLIKSIPNARNLEAKKYKFQAFVSKHLVIQEVDCGAMQKMNDLFDRFITGSDQLWNYAVCGDDDTYFLDFVEDSRKKYSYAVSFGMQSCFESHEERILTNLKDFSCISLREKICEDKLCSLMCDIRTDIDPTLMMDTELWLEQFPLMNTEGNYILIYCVAPPKGLMDIARKLASTTGLKIVFLTDLIVARYKYHDLRALYGQGPEDFLALIKNAQYVLTTSFHGTVFAIKFHKRFYAEIDNLNGHNDRISGLIKALSLEECTDPSFVFAQKELSEEKWRQVDQTIGKLKEESIQYLERIVN